MMSVAEAARALQARISVPNLDRTAADRLRFHSVSTDSRNIDQGALFIALRGDRFDGHAFIGAVGERGAVAAIVDEESVQSLAAQKDLSLVLIIVADTRRALGRLAAYWRGKFDIPLIAVTGSNGKTTVKEMIAAILRAHYGSEHTLSTAGNFNNDIGLPLTLLRLRTGHTCAVVEIGMNHPGETRELAAIARPTVALINNAQREHQEFMTSVEEVAREHGSLFESLAENGVAVINADDDYAAYWRGLNAGRTIRDFGVDHPAAVHGNYQFRDFGSEIVLTAPEGGTRFELGVAGLHNVRNAMAAAAAATAAGASLDAVAAGLSSFAAVKGRLQRKASRNGAVVIDDTYNANPDSVRAAIDVLALCPSLRVLVLGDMGEVGEAGPAFHREIGTHARTRGIDRLVTLGDMTTHATAAFGEHGLHAASFEELLQAVRSSDRPGTTYLVKGSRFMRMERAVEALTGEKA
jgi:UDP-N-acetylmuramoyl-tripeptide--D-alanyl-D-alanine ligase